MLGYYTQLRSHGTALITVIIISHFRSFGPLYEMNVLYFKLSELLKRVNEREF
jgi:hypothetical protein